MNFASPTAIPNPVMKGLLAFWIAWVVAVVTGLYQELSLIHEQMEALKADNPFQANTFVGLALAVPFLLLTPKFIGSTLAAVMLLFVKRRRSWSRWVLLIGLVTSGAALTANILDSSTHGITRSHAWTMALTGVTYLVMVVAVAQFFTAEASAWFKSRASSPKKKASQHDVA
jgi:hypothetical protein